MAWLQLVMEVTPQAADGVEEWLLEQGALSVTLSDGADQPLFEPPPGETPLWSDTRLTALFDSDCELEPLLSRLGRLHPSSRCRVEPLEDRDWISVWLDHFRPMRFGQRLWVIPGEYQPPDPNAINLALDPGLAFGTGTHPTTALCLEWLDTHPPAGMRVVDYGCGSGILAIAALRLGAGSVLGVDHDPQALIASRNNAERNGVDGAIELVSPALEPEWRADLLLANILANPLISLAPHFAARVPAGGRIVLSGILDEQAASVAGHYRPWFELDPPTVRDEWVRLTGVRNKTEPPAHTLPRSLSDLGDRGAGDGEQSQFFANLRRIVSYSTKICGKVVLLSRFCGRFILSPTGSY